MPDGVEQTLRRVHQLVIVLAVASIVLLGALGFLIGWPVLGLVLGALLGGLLAFRVLKGGQGALLATLGARPASETEFGRYHNLVDGLCVTTGLAKPALWVIDDVGANALALGRTPNEAALVVTTGLLDALQRIELEGVLASLLGQIRSGETRAQALVMAAASVLGPVAGSPVKVANRLLDDERVGRIDVGGCRITRYPPGFIAALERLASQSTQVAASPAGAAPLWLIPLAPAPGVPTLDERIAMLREL
jgi:heat shock protein HtpX